MWITLKCYKCTKNTSAKYNDSVVSRDSIISVLCDSCALSLEQQSCEYLRLRIEKLEKIINEQNKQHCNCHTCVAMRTLAELEEGNL